MNSDIKIFIHVAELYFIVYCAIIQSQNIGPL